jgi:formylglycine-generating enzyme required for sulfatase activity
MSMEPRKLLTRRNLIIGSLFGGGLVSVLASQRESSSATRAIASGLDLQTFNFETVKVNEFGEIVERKTAQTQRFIEDLGDGIELEMVAIPGGSFLMGTPPDEKILWEGDGEFPQHEVKLKPFYMGRFLTTQEQWSAVMGRFLREPKFKGEKHPMERVSWQDAQEFCKALSIKAGKTYRLPSEAEWEYACRAGTTTTFHYGEAITTDIANYNGKDDQYFLGLPGEDREETTEVGLFPANAWGLHDMHGNLWEWCEDVWSNSYHGAPRDGRARSSLLLLLGYPYKVVRGGSWIVGPHSVRSADRLEYPETYRLSRIGFRVVCSSS